MSDDEYIPCDADVIEGLVLAKKDVSLLAWGLQILVTDKTQVQDKERYANIWIDHAIEALKRHTPKL